MGSLIPRLFWRLWCCTWALLFALCAWAVASGPVLAPAALSALALGSVLAIPSGAVLGITGPRGGHRSDGPGPASLDPLPDPERYVIPTVEVEGLEGWPVVVSRDWQPRPSSPAYQPPPGRRNLESWE